MELNFDKLMLSEKDIEIAEKNDNYIIFCINQLPNEWITDIGRKEMIAVSKKIRIMIGKL